MKSCFLLNGMRMAKMYLFVGSKIQMQIITALLASENIGTMEMRGGYSILPHASSGLMNSVFRISFFPSKLKYVR